MNADEYLNADSQSHEPVINIDAQPQDIIYYIAEIDEDDEFDDVLIEEQPKVDAKEAIEGLKKSITFIEQSGDESMEINLRYIYKLITKIESKERKLKQDSAAKITLDSFLRKST